MCDNKTLMKANDDTTCDHPHKVVNIILLWVSGLLYNAVDSSTRNILVLFQLMEPLHWNVTQVSRFETSFPSAFAVLMFVLKNK